MKFKFSSIRRVNYLHTLLFNFRTFPFHVARHLPVLIGYKVKISAPSRKCFSLSEDFDLHGAPIELGVRTNFSKGIPTQIRLIKKSSRLVLSNAVRVSKGSTILLHHGTLHMGKNSYCGERVLIVCHNRIDIGYNVAIAWNS